MTILLLMESSGSPHTPGRFVAPAGRCRVCVVASGAGVEKLRRFLRACGAGPRKSAAARAPRRGAAAPSAADDASAMAYEAWAMAIEVLARADEARAMAAAVTSMACATSAMA